MYKPSDDNAVLNLCFLLFGTSDKVRAVISRELRKLGLTFAQAAVLHTLASSPGPLSEIEIARRLFRESHTIVGLVHRMTEKGLVEKKRGPKGNVTQVTMTSKGRELYRLATSSNMVSSMSRVMSALPIESYEGLAASLLLIRTGAIEELKKP